MKLTELIDPFASADGPPPTKLFAFLRWSLKGAGLAIFIAGVFSAMAGVAEVFSAVMLGWIIDAALASRAEAVFSDSFGLLIASLIFFLVARPGLLGLSSYTQTMMVQPGLANLILSRLHRYTLGQSVSFFDDDFAGRIAQKEMQTARAINDIITEFIHAILFALASVAGSILLLGSVDLRIASCLVLWMIAYIGMIRFFMPRIRLRSKARAGARAMITGQLVDTVTNIHTVKLFAHADHEDQAALDAMSDYRSRSLEFGRVSVAFRFSLMTLAGVLPVLLVGGALWFWSRGLISAGEIAATGAVSLRLAQMTGWVSFTLMGLYANIGEAEDGIRTLTPTHKLTDAENASELEVGAAQVAFDDVSFAYGRDVGGVQNLSLTIQSGEKLALVGASGAGKSTLVALLLRLYDTESGSIRIDGQKTSGVTQESLRRQIGMVTQETAMFNRSARDNIAYGRPDASDAEVIEAARRAEAHEFIEGLEDHSGRTGYDAHLGERGVKLSGGQRQRIALARAILKDAPILVLDEATSALDSEVEASIQAALETVMEGKTVIAIAHRLSTIARMDRIVVLHEGKIAEAGNHEELLAKGGLYAKYWSRQSGGFLNLDAPE